MSANPPQSTLSCRCNWSWRCSCGRCCVCGGAHAGRALRISQCKQSGLLCTLLSAQKTLLRTVENLGPVQGSHMGRMAGLMAQATQAMQTLMEVQIQLQIDSDSDSDSQTESDLETNTNTKTKTKTSMEATTRVDAADVLQQGRAVWWEGVNEAILRNVLRFVPASARERATGLLQPLLVGVESRVPVPLWMLVLRIHCALEQIHHDLYHHAAPHAHHPDEQLLLLNPVHVQLPHPSKGAPGEDAVATSQSLICVADGVGGWRGKDGCKDPGEYARALTQAVLHSPSRLHIPDSHALVITPAPTCSPLMHPGVLLQQAFQRVRSADVRGGATACVLTLEGDILRTAVIGDCAFLVLRPVAASSMELLFRSHRLLHSFNCPVQLSHASASLHPDQAALCASMRIRPGDCIIAGSDGLFDNLFVEDIQALAGWLQRDPVRLANVLAARARLVSMSRTIHTPYSCDAAANGLRKSGGKVDDITVVVSVVQSSFQRGEPRHRHHYH